MYNPGIDTIPDISLWWMGTEETNGEEVIRMGPKPSPDPKPASEKPTKIWHPGEGQR